MEKILYKKSKLLNKNNPFFLNNINITQPSILVLSNSSPPTNASCNGGNNGAISLGVLGGSPGYTFLWSNGATTQNISSLTKGQYRVTVTDSKFCTSTFTQMITEPNVLQGTLVVTDALCNSSLNGSVDLTVIGGTGPFMYLWSNAATTEDILNIGTGRYIVTITDSKSCTAEAITSVNEPPKVSISASITNL